MQMTHFAYDDLAFSRSLLLLNRQIALTSCASNGSDDGGRTIKTQLVHGMQTITDLDSTEGIMMITVVVDAMKGHSEMHNQTTLVHGDISPANLLWYRGKGHEVVGVLNDFDTFTHADVHDKKRRVQSLMKAIRGLSLAHN